METLWQDLRYAGRQLLRSPGFTVAAVFTLALGLGGTTTIFSLINALLLRPLPVYEPERLIEITTVGENGSEFNTFSYPDYTDLREGTNVLSGLAAYGLRKFGLGVGEQAAVTVGATVSGNYFQVLGIRPSRGRFFTPEDDAPGAAPVAVLGWEAWQRRFGADPSVVGSVIRLNGKPVTVVGIAPRGFNGTINILGMDVWVPIAATPQLAPGTRLDTRDHMWLQMVGRLAPGVSRERAEAALSGRARQFSAASPPHARMRAVQVQPLRGLTGPMRTGALGVSALLLTTALLVLLIASVNVAGMLLARTAARRREVAIRLAIGAGRGRLIRQLLTESTLLWTLGGLAGLVLAAWLGDLLPKLVPEQGAAFPVRFALELGVDVRVFAFALGLSLLTGVIFGLAPALRASRPNLVPVLKDAVEPGGRSRLRDALVVGQIATSLLLLVGAGLFLRTVMHTATVEPGFDPDGVVVAGVDLKVQGYP
jgi:predicted permease